MCLPVGLANPILRDVSVNFGGSDVGVPEQRLNAAKIGAARQEMRRERVAQLVRVDVAAEPRTSRRASDDLPKRLACQFATTR